MNSDWQTIAVLLIVGLTAGCFLRNLWRSKKHCGQDCACGASKIKRHRVIEKILQKRRNQ